jgi:Bifunctional DNA primase/polymerase, N-terminal
MTPQQRDSLQAALRLGVPAFPCFANKRPATPQGFKNARTADGGLATMWARHPGELVGVPTGALSGISVLDLDRGKGGDAWWAAHKSRLPLTRVHRTRSGGLHLVFKDKPGLRGSAGKIAPGVDVRADGGYIIWWPAAGLEVRDAPLADWPHWLMPPAAEQQSNIRSFHSHGAATAAGSIDAQLRGIAKRVERAREGERNSVLFGAACRVCELLRDEKLPKHVSESWCAGLLHLVARRAGLPNDEAQRTIASGFRIAGNG